MSHAIEPINGKIFDSIRVIRIDYKESERAGADQTGRLVYRIQCLACGNELFMRRRRILKGGKCRSCTGEERTK